MYASSAVTRLKKMTIKWFISDDKIMKISFGIPTPQCTAYLHIFITMPRKYHGKKHLQLPVWQPWFPSGPKPLLEWITDIFPAVIIPLGYVLRRVLDTYLRSAPFPISVVRLSGIGRYISFIRRASDRCQKNIRYLLMIQRQILFLLLNKHR